MTEPLPSQPLVPESSSSSSTPSFHGANALNYRAPAEAAAASLGRKVEFEEIAVPPGGCVVHAQDCWHGSAPNVSTNRHRRALVVHFLRGDARFIDGHSLQVAKPIQAVLGVRCVQREKNRIPVIQRRHEDGEKRTFRGRSRCEDMRFLVSCRLVVFQQPGVAQPIRDYTVCSSSSFTHTCCTSRCRERAVPPTFTAGTRCWTATCCPRRRSPSLSPEMVAGQAGSTHSSCHSSFGGSRVAPGGLVTTVDGVIYCTRVTHCRLPQIKYESVTTGWRYVNASSGNAPTIDLGAQIKPYLVHIFTQLYVGK